MNVKEKERLRIFLDELAELLDKHHATLLAHPDYDISCIDVEFDGPSTAQCLGGHVDTYVKTNWNVKHALEA